MRKKSDQSNYMSTVTAGLGTGTSGNGYNENWDQMAKFGWDQGPHDKIWLGPGTKRQKLAGTRDQMAKTGWDQGPSHPPIQSLNLQAPQLLLLRAYISI